MVNLVLPHLPDALAPLQVLALDLRWTWSHEADALWEPLRELRQSNRPGRRAHRRPHFEY